MADRQDWQAKAAKELLSEGVREVLIAADRGADGEASAEQLRAGLVGAGVKARIALPPEGFGDWNEAEDAGLLDPVLT